MHNFDYSFPYLKTVSCILLCSFFKLSVSMFPGMNIFTLGFFPQHRKTRCNGDKLLTVSQIGSFDNYISYRLVISEVTMKYASRTVLNVTPKKRTLSASWKLLSLWKVWVKGNAMLLTPSCPVWQILVTYFYLT